MKATSFSKFLFAAAGSMAVCAGPACADGAADIDAKALEGKRIGISIPSADHGWTGGVVFWAKQAKKDIEAKYPGAKVTIAAAKSSADQVSNIENMMVQGIDALVVLPQEPAPLTPACKRVAEKGVKLVVVDRGLSEPVQDLLVAGDNPGFGRVSGEQIAKAIDGKGKIALMQGVLCQVNTDRVEAFKKVMARYPDIEIVGEGVSNWSSAEGLKLMENYLQKNPVIDAVWAGDDDVLLGALRAYKASGRKDVKTMLGGGGSKVVIKRIIDGDPLVTQTVTYPPRMIYVGAEEAVKLVAGIAPQDKVKVVPAEVIDASNAKDNYFPESAY